MISQFNKSNKLSKFARNRKISNKRITHNTLSGGSRSNPPSNRDAHPGQPPPLYREREITEPPPPPSYMVYDTDKQKRQITYNIKLITEKQKNFDHINIKYTGLCEELEINNKILKKLRTEIAKYTITKIKEKSKLLSLITENTRLQSHATPPLLPQPPKQTLPLPQVNAKLLQRNIPNIYTKTIENLNKIDENIRLKVKEYLEFQLVNSSGKNNNSNIKDFNSFMIQYSDINSNPNVDTEKDALQKALLYYGRKMLLKMLKKEDLTD